MQDVEIEWEHERKGSSPEREEQERAWSEGITEAEEGLSLEERRPATWGDKEGQWRDRDNV